MWAARRLAQRSPLRSPLSEAGPTCALATSASAPAPDPDVLIVGAGHNGLIAATLLARQGLRVEVVEERRVVGGAAKTEYPFPKAPGLPQSTGAYLLGVMPPELMALLGISDLPLRRRDPHYFLPTTSGRYLLFGSDAAATRAQFERFFSREDWEAHSALQAELAEIREDLAPAWFRQPMAVEAAAERHLRPALRDRFVALCRGSVRQYLDRFGFRSDLLKAMYATTDGFSGLTGGWDTPGSGHNFLAHNMGRLPGSDGTWMVVEGGMGAVTQRLARAALDAGASLRVGAPVEQILIDGGVARGVALRGGEERRARAVVVNADPFTLRQLAGAGALPAEVNAKLDALWRGGTTMKVNLALRGAPQYSCLSEDLGQHRTTTHLLPDEADVMRLTEAAFADALAGKLPEHPTIEVYTHQGMQDAAGRHSAALFVQWVPHEVAGSSWASERESYVEHLLRIWERFAPGVSSLVEDAFALAPPDIQAHFGIAGGHIHHVDNCFSFDERFPYAVPGVEGLYSCSAGTFPAGSVLGAAGHNAAARVISDLGLQQHWRAPLS